MKYVLVFIHIIAVSAIFGQKRLKAYVDTKQFYDPSIGEYVEIQFQYDALSLEFTGQDGGLIADIGAQVSILQDTTVVQQESFRIQSPLMADSIIENFFDVRRYALKPGDYRVFLSLFDMNTTDSPIEAKFPLKVESFAGAVTVSDIIIGESVREGDPNSPFFKSGYEIIPYFSNYFPSELTYIPAYFEIYNTDLLPDSIFGVRQSLLDDLDQVEIEAFSRFTKLSTGPISVYLNPVKIESLPSGEYTLKFEVLNRNMDVLTEEIYKFQRDNARDIVVTTNDIVLDPKFQESITDDSVSYYVASLIPISGPTQVKLLISELKRKDNESLRKLIQSYWTKTATTSSKVYDEWMAYKRQVQLVEELFSTNFQSGHETDRGRVYLQYGSPSRTIERPNSPSEYPYEIWEYNKIGRFSNRKFIFYNPNLTNNTYLLLHSDMVGELQNKRWSYELNKRNTQNGNVDDPNQFNKEGFGNNAREWYRNY